MKTPNPGYKTLPLTALHEDPGNARKHSGANLAAIRKSLTWKKISRGGFWIWALVQGPEYFGEFKRNRYWR
jgi:hypothetical protein